MKVRLIKADKIDEGKGYENGETFNVIGGRMNDGRVAYTIENHVDFFYEHQVELVETEDPIVESVINQFKTRSEVGIKKYGTTLERNDLSTLQWIEEAQAEAMDFCLYLERLKQEFKTKE
jgi:hypothetical protein